MKKIWLIFVSVMLITQLSSCKTASQHRAEVEDSTTDKISIGSVQRGIKVGMSSASVVEVLGSPNMVSTDASRNEVWVYDKIQTTTTSSASGYSFFESSVSGASSASQKTLTIIVKFDNNNLVKDFSYRTSSF
jgi:outer membrane protein assembly factor BamE (lipoprotein component of BamABCDE complex)